MTNYEIREYRPGDEQSLLETFNVVFGEREAQFVPRSMEEWKWAHLDNPAGFRLFLALADGKAVGQFAGHPLRSWVAGEERTFVHCVDSMVHPEHRRGLKRPGLFVNIAKAYFAAYGGPDKDQVHFGMPIEEAARIGKTFLEYGHVRNQVFLAREIGAGSTQLPPSVRKIERFDHQLRWLYDRCVGLWGASTIRDDSYFNWRFIDHPKHAYHCLGVYDAEEVLRGVAVCRRAKWLADDVEWIVDWLVPPDEPEVGELLRRAVMALARSDNAPAASILLPEWSPWFEDFQAAGWLVHPSIYVMWTRHFHAKREPGWLRNHWWYQLSDMDLV